jgi:predicted dinucleotide-binding enzyme
MRVGVLGTGEVGRALGTAFASLGHEVRMGARSQASEKALAWAREAGPKASAGTFADAAAFGEIVVLAVLGDAAEQVLQLAGRETLRGKLVIDTTNPLDFGGGFPRLSVGHTDSLGERVQRWLPDAHVVKAFNTVGNPLMFRPNLPGGPPDMFICGNSDEAKRAVAGLLADFGWGVVDLGGIESSRYLEPMCMAWVVYAARNNSGSHAFKLLRK